MSRDRRIAAADLDAAAGAEPTDEPGALAAAAIGHHRAGRFGDAEAGYRRLLALQPGRADVLFNLAAALHQQGRLEEAAAAWRDTVRLAPGLAQAHYNLGTALDALRRPDEAAAAYRAAIAADATLAEAHSNLGNILSAQGRLDDAIACFRRALALAPERPGLHYNLANALNDRGALEQAADAYRAAIALKPDHADARANLAIVLMNQGRIGDADAEFRRALGIAPDNTDIRSNWLFCLNYETDVSAEDVFAAHRDWETHLPAASPTVHANDRTPTRRLKVGYVSPDMRMHSVAYFVEPLLQAHDRQAVEVTCYADVAKPDRVTARLETLADRWVSTVGMSDDALAARVKADAIDILVDCAGHTAHNRLRVFARKPAPVQASWLGYPNSTGLGAIDYRVVDAVTDPPGAADALASEDLVRLAGGFLCYGGADDAPAPAPPPCLSAGSVTFGSFNNPAKLSAVTLDAWAALLKRLPDARLLLKGKPFADAATRDLYRERLAARGIAPKRVELIGWTPGSAHHLKLYERVDIALDPFPYNGTTTTCEALWMGVPVVTLKGDRHGGRVGASLLTRIGAEEWIAETTESYIECAAQLAADPSHLQALRRTLRARVAGSPLCDRAAFARAMETAYREMWRAWCAAGA